MNVIKLSPIEAKSNIRISEAADTIKNLIKGEIAFGSNELVVSSTFFALEKDEKEKDRRKEK